LSTKKPAPRPRAKRGRRIARAGPRSVGLPSASRVETAVEHRRSIDPSDFSIHQKRVAHITVPML